MSTNGSESAVSRCSSTVKFMVDWAALEPQRPAPWRELLGDSTPRKRAKQTPPLDPEWWARHPVLVDGVVFYRIGRLAAAFGVSSRRCATGSAMDGCPRPRTGSRTWTGVALGVFTRRRRIAERIAVEEGVRGARRTDLATSSFGIRLTRAWRRLS